MQTVRSVLVFQMILMLTLSVMLACVDPRAGFSLLCGAGVAIIGQVYLAMKLFGVKHELTAPKVLLGFYRGVVGRFLLMVILLAVLLSLHVLIAGALIVGFILALLFAGFNPLWVRQYSSMRRATV